MHGNSKLFLVGPLPTSNAEAGGLVYVLQVKAYKALVLLENFHCIRRFLLRMLSRHQFEERMVLPLDAEQPRENQSDAGEVLEVFQQDLSAALVGY